MANFGLYFTIIFCLFSCVAASYSDLLKFHDPVVYWKMDESNGETSGYDSIQSLRIVGSGGVQFGVSSLSRLHYSVSLDGTESSLLNSSYLSSMAPAYGTVLCWARVEAGSGSSRPLISTRTGVGGYVLECTDGDTWGFWVSDGSDFVGVQAATNTCTIGEWAMLAATYNTSTGVRELYINGIFQGAEVASGGTVPGSGGSFQVGGGLNWEGTLNYFTGRVDEVAILPSAISGCEALELYDNVTGFRNASNADYSSYVQSLGPVAYWDFEQSSTLDRSLNGHNGNASNLCFSLRSAEPTLGASSLFNRYVESELNVGVSDAWEFDDMSVVAWVYIGHSYTDTMRPIIGNRNDGAGGFLLECNDANTFDFFITYGNKVGGVTSTVECTPGKWTFVTGTYQSSEKKFTIFVDGEYDSENSMTKTFESSSVQPLRVGAGYDANRDFSYFHGKVDEVALFDWKLSHCEVKRLYEIATGTVPEVMYLDPTTKYSYMVLELDPLRYWNFNNDPGDGLTLDVAQDVRSNVSDGICANQTGPSQYAGYGLGFASYEDVVIAVPDSPDFAPAQLSVSLWFKAEGESGSSREILSTLNGYTGFSIHCHTNDYLRFYIGAGTYLTGIASNKEYCSLGDWHFAVLEYNAEKNEMLMFVDGALEINSQFEEDLYLDPPEGTTFKIGGGVANNDVSGVSYWYGLVDEVAIYDSLLTTCEIQDLFYAVNDSTNPDFSTNGATGYYRNMIKNTLSARSFWDYDNIDCGFAVDCIQNIIANISGGACPNRSSYTQELGLSMMVYPYDYGHLVADCENCFESNQFTLALWAKAEGSVGDERILASNFWHGHGFTLECSGNAEVFRWSWGVGGTNYSHWSSNIKSISNCFVGDWHFVAATIDADAGAMSLYIDGELEVSNKEDGTVCLNSSSHFYMGGGFVIDQETLFKSWDGRIDNVALFDYVLSSEQISEIYNAAFFNGTWPTPTSSPVASPTETPTVTPTKTPTATPTGTPTKAPTGTPTSTPTKIPTEIPTQAPTQNPTQKQTQTPTQNPTKTPTQNPSQAPTQKQAETPTQISTQTPTQKQTQTPTQNPTKAPTQNPTQAPTQKQAQTPTQIPTQKQTQTPTQNPTQTPTGTITSTLFSTSTGTQTVVTTEIPTVIRTLTGTPTMAATISLTDNLIFTTASSTHVPSRSPSSSPTLLAVSTAPQTLAPTSSPVTTVPTTAEPTTSPSVLATTLVPTVLPIPSLSPTSTPTVSPTEPSDYSDKLLINTTMFAVSETWVSIGVVANFDGQIWYTCVEKGQEGSIDYWTVRFDGEQLSVSPGEEETFLLSSLLPNSVYYCYFVGRERTTKLKTTFEAFNATRLLFTTAPQPPSLKKVQFSATGGYLIITFDSDTDQGAASGLGTDFECEDIFSFQGMASYCSWKSLNEAFMYLDSFSTILDGDSVQLVNQKIKGACYDQDNSGCSYWSFNSPSNFSVLRPDPEIFPDIVAEYSPKVSKCSDIAIDLSETTGSGGRDLSIDWALLEPDDDSVSQYLESFNDQTGILLPNTYLTSGTNYSFNVTVTNMFLNSKFATVVVTVSAYDIPQLEIEGPQSRYMWRFEALSMYASSSNSCEDENHLIDYTWESLTDQSLNSFSVNPRYMKLEKYSLAVQSWYSFKCTARHRITGLINAETVQVYVKLSPISVSFIGGSRKSIGSSDALVLSLYVEDLDESTGVADEEYVTYIWSCVKANGDACGFESLLDGNAIHASSNKVEEGATYLFTVNVTASFNRTGSAQAEVYVQSYPLPRIKILTSYASKVNIDDKLDIYAKVILDDEDAGAATSQWIATDASAGYSSKSLEDATSTDLIKYSEAGTKTPHNFVVMENQLAAPSSYTFCLTAVYDAYQDVPAAYVYAEIQIETNEPPTSGDFAVSPLVGYVIQDVFDMTCTGWVDEDLPLFYSFLYSQSDLDYVLQMKKLSTSVSDVFLPQGIGSNYSVKTIARIYDVLEGSSRATQYVTVLPSTASLSELSSQINILLNWTLTELDPESSVALVEVAMSVLNAQNCSFAPECESLNREPCGAGEPSEPNECGACLDGYFNTDYYSPNSFCSLQVLTCSNGVQDGNETDIDCGGGSCPGCSVDESCNVDTDCEYNSCSKQGVCKPPKKQCIIPDCSGRGNCTYFDYYGDVLEDCREGKTCDAYCVCERKWKGTDGCEYVAEDYLAIKDFKSDLVDGLVAAAELTDLNEEALNQLSGSLSEVLSPIKEVRKDAQKSAVALLGDLTEYAAETGDLDSSTAAFMTEALSLGLQSHVVEGKTLKLHETLSDSVDNFGVAMNAGLIPGEDAKSYSDHVFRIAAKQLDPVAEKDIEAVEERNAERRATASVTFGNTADGIFLDGTDVVLAEMVVNPYLANGTNATFSNFTHVSGLVRLNAGLDTEEGRRRLQEYNATFLNVTVNISTYVDVNYSASSLPETIDVVCADGEYATKSVNCSGSLVTFECLGIAQVGNLSCRSASLTPRCTVWNLDESEYSDLCSAVAYDETVTTCVCTLYGSNVPLVNQIDVSVVVEALGNEFVQTWAYAGVLFEQGGVTQTYIIIITLGILLAIIGSILLIFYATDIFYQKRMDSAKEDMDRSATSLENSDQTDCTDPVQVAVDLASNDSGSPTTIKIHSPTSTRGSAHFFGESKKEDRQETAQTAIINTSPCAIPQRQKHEGRSKHLISMPDVVTIQMFKRVRFKLFKRMKAENPWFKLLNTKTSPKERLVMAAHVAVACVTLMAIDALIYDVAYPDSGPCSSFTNVGDCLEQESPYDSRLSVCSWHVEGQYCFFNSPPITWETVVFVSVITYVMFLPLHFLLTRFINLTIERPVKRYTSVNTKDSYGDNEVLRRLGSWEKQYCVEDQYTQPKRKSLLEMTVMRVRSLSPRMMAPTNTRPSPKSPLSTQVDNTFPGTAQNSFNPNIKTMLDASDSESEESIDASKLQRMNTSQSARKHLKSFRASLRSSVRRRSLIQLLDPTLLDKSHATEIEQRMEDNLDDEVEDLLLDDKELFLEKHGDNCLIRFWYGRLRHGREAIIRSHVIIAAKARHVIKGLTEPHASFCHIEIAHQDCLTLGERKTAYRVTHEAFDKKKCVPLWVHFFGWLFVVLYVLSTSFYTILFGLDHDHSTTLMWLLTFLLGYFQDLFAIIPLRVLFLYRALPSLISHKANIEDIKNIPFYCASQLIARDFPMLSSSQLMKKELDRNTELELAAIFKGKIRFMKQKKNQKRLVIFLCLVGNMLLFLFSLLPFCFQDFAIDASLASLGGVVVAAVWHVVSVSDDYLIGTVCFFGIIFLIMLVRQQIKLYLWQPLKSRFFSGDDSKDKMKKELVTKSVREQMGNDSVIEKEQVLFKNFFAPTPVITGTIIPAPRGTKKPGDILSPKLVSAPKQSLRLDSDDYDGRFPTNKSSPQAGSVIGDDTVSGKIRAARERSNAVCKRPRSVSPAKGPLPTKSFGLVHRPGPKLIGSNCRSGSTSPLQTRHRISSTECYPQVLPKAPSRRNTLRRPQSNHSLFLQPMELASINNVKMETPPPDASPVLSAPLQKDDSLHLKNIDISLDNQNNLDSMFTSPLAADSPSNSSDPQAAKMPPSFNLSLNDEASLDAMFSNPMEDDSPSNLLSRLQTPLAPSPRNLHRPKSFRSSK